MDLTVKDNKNMIIGWCRDVGSQINAIHIRKGFVGFYNKSSDITMDATGKIFCYGNGAQILVWNAENK